MQTADTDNGMSDCKDPIVSLLVLLCIASAVIVLPAMAIRDDYLENKALWSKALSDSRARNDRILLPDPPYPTDNPAERGTYTGPCPVGGSAPQLRQPGLSTGALCRGACGMDCPDERCSPVPNFAPVKTDGGTCTYPNVIACISHKGCRDHDACYDYCTEVLHETSLVSGHCHGLCNQRCYDEYGYANCVLWAALPGSISSTAAFWQDYAASPLTDKTLYFSDEPVFTADKVASAADQKPCDSINPYDCWTGTFSPH